MRPSNKVGYGLAALVDLALAERGSASRQGAQARNIAARQGVPLRYLEQILRDLRRAGIVAAKRGPAGGYVLARDPGRISLAELVETLDGSMVEILAGERPRRSGRRRAGSRPSAGAGQLVGSIILRELAEKVAALYSSVTLQDVVDRASAFGVTPAPPQMYFI